jgi:inosine-uridine nucleoside N-ribohydrolase
VAAKFLDRVGRADVPVGIGDNQGTRGDDTKTLTPWIAGYDIAKYPGRVYQDGIAALIDIVEKSPKSVTIVAIGPVHSLALALERAPDIASKCRLVGMYGSFDAGYGGGKVSAETNVRVNPAGLRAVLRAPWQDILLTPLDTCGLVGLDGERYHAIWCATGDPLLRNLIESYCIFAPRQTWMNCDFFTTRSTTLFDCVAVYLAYSEKRVEVETISFDVTDDGFTRRAAGGPFKARVAIRWTDLDGFDGHLADRLLGR